MATLKRLNEELARALTASEEGQAYAYGGGGLLLAVLIIVLLVLLLR
jgi:hypothetical protein